MLATAAMAAAGGSGGLGGETARTAAEEDARLASIFSTNARTEGVPGGSLFLFGVVAVLVVVAWSRAKLFGRAEGTGVTGGAEGVSGAESVCSWPVKPQLSWALNNRCLRTAKSFSARSTGLCKSPVPVTAIRAVCELLRELVLLLEDATVAVDARVQFESFDTSSRPLEDAQLAQSTAAKILEQFRCVSSLSLTVEQTESL